MSRHPTADRTRRGHRLLGTTLVATLALVGSARGDQLSARLVGNAAVEITDGQRTLLTDFPYESGAYGYLRYGEDELYPRPSSRCLFPQAADWITPDLGDAIPLGAATPQGTDP